MKLESAVLCEKMLLLNWSILRARDSFLDIEVILEND